MNRTKVTPTAPGTAICSKAGRTVITYEEKTLLLDATGSHTELSGGTQTLVFESAVTGPRGPKGEPGDSQMYWTTAQW